MKCDFCQTELQKNVRIVGLFGLSEIAPLYCANHGVCYTKKKEKEMAKTIQTLYHRKQII